MNAPAIVPFIFENHTFRTITNEQGETLFCGKDAAVALGYENHSEALKYHCRGVAKRYPIVDSLGRTQEARFITEPDLLRLIVSSKLESAQRFEAWVFEEVLPSIRKTGSYGVPEFTSPGLQHIYQMLLEQERADRRATEAEKRITALEGEARGVRVNEREASAMGREASRRCRQLGIQYGSVPHGKYGTVHTYPEEMLDELYAELPGRKQEWWR